MLCELLILYLFCCVIDIVNGKVNSIMRLVLALAAHYKPSSVRESRHRSSLASYAQVVCGRMNITDSDLSVFSMIGIIYRFPRAPAWTRFFALKVRVCTDWPQTWSTHTRYRLSTFAQFFRQSEIFVTQKNFFLWKIKKNHISKTSQIFSRNF